MSARISDWTGMYFAIATHPKEAVDFIHVSDVVGRLTKYREAMDREMPVDEKNPGPNQLYQILFDICQLLELKPQEIQTVLGAEMYARLMPRLNPKIHE